LEVVQNDHEIISTVLEIRIDDSPDSVCCLQESINVKLDFDDVSINLVPALIDIIKRFEAINSKEFCEKWRSFDGMHAKNITLEI
jgi:hypothetical protein